MSGLFGGHKSGEINAGVSRSRRLIVSRALMTFWSKSKQFLNKNISHGSVVTHLWCGGMFHNDFVENLLLSLSVKEFWKSVNIWRSYRQKYSGMFFWLTPIRKCQLQHIYACSSSAVRASGKCLIANRKSTTSFTKSYRWSTLSSQWVTQRRQFYWWKFAITFLCVKTFISHVVDKAFAYLMVNKYRQET